MKVGTGEQFKWIGRKNLIWSKLLVIWTYGIIMLRDVYGFGDLINENLEA